MTTCRWCGRDGADHHDNGDSIACQSSPDGHYAPITSQELP